MPYNPEKTNGSYSPDTEIVAEQDSSSIQLDSTHAFTPVMAGKWHSFFVLRLIWLHIAWLAFKHIKNPLKATYALRKLARIRRQFMGDYSLIKLAKADGRYYFDLNTPGWPSLSFDQYHIGELNRIIPFQDSPFILKTLLLAITKKCALRCEHCFEWDALNGKEKLSIADLQHIVQQFQATGVAQVQLSGGEPMLRIQAIVDLLQAAKPGTDFWVLTSGHQLTLENALTLKKAGLIGVTISLDEVEPEKHNQFRGFAPAYEWVEKAIHHARQANLLVSLSLCATRQFVTEENLMRYAQLAKEAGVAFIQVLEPRAVGHYAGKIVALSAAQEKILEEFYIKLKYNPDYQSYPIITYHEYHRKRASCVGAADRYLYVDTDGQMHACPFCRSKSGCTIKDDISGVMKAMQSAGCPNHTH